MPHAGASSSAGFAALDDELRLLSRLVALRLVGVVALPVVENVLARRVDVAAAHSESSGCVALEAGALVVELRDRVAELLTFRGEVALVLGVGLDLERHLLDDGEPVAVEPRELPRVVREDADRRQPEVGEDLVADAPLPRVGREPEREVRLDRVEAGRLELVCRSLFRSPMPRPSCPMYRTTPRPSASIRASACSSWSPQSQRSEWKTSPVRHSECTRTRTSLGALDVALHEREVLLVRQELAVRDRLELAVLGREPHGDDPLDELLAAPAVLDEVGDRDHLQVVALAERRRGRGRAPSSRRRS